MLERVAMHQTRLRVPGLGIDAKGVVLGGRGLVLLASVERLVAFLSLYTSERSLQDIAPAIRIELVRSKHGAREVLLSFPVQHSEFLDHAAEVARLALGHTFTGSSRHYVQFRDASAPFGYDSSEVIPSDSDYVLYHTMYTQAYTRERDFDLARLLLRLRPHLDPASIRDVGPLWILAEEGLGPAWIHYLVRNHVDAKVGIAEWPPLSSLEDQPVRRYLFHVEQLPTRMLPLARTTPGLTSFRPLTAGAGVQVGYRHPVNLRSCPVFSEDGLVLFRGDHPDPVVLARLPSMGDVSSFARVSFNDHMQIIPAEPVNARSMPEVSVPVRLAPSLEGYRSIRATYLSQADYPTLRRILYGLGRQTLHDAQIAFARSGGAMLIHPSGIESIPVGTFLRELRPGLFVAAGYDTVPAVDPEILFRALGSPSEYRVLLLPEQPAIAFPTSAFVRLEEALVEGHTWAPLDPIDMAPVLDASIPLVCFDEVQEPPSGVGQGVPQLPAGTSDEAT